MAGTKKSIVTKDHRKTRSAASQLLAFLFLMLFEIRESGLAQESDRVSLINEANIRGHVRFLANDLLEGRGRGSRGDELTQL